MRLVIIIAVAVVLLGGGGAAWWFLLREPAAEEPPSAPTAGENSGKKSLETQSVFELEPFVLPILREGQVTQHLTLVLRLELAGPMERLEFKKYSTALRDALFTELHGIFAFRHVQDGAEATPLVRERLVAAGNQVLGPGKIKAVLVEGVSRRVPGEG